jgi:hypothetical protein
MERTEKLLKAFITAGEIAKHEVTPAQGEMSANQARLNSIPNAQSCPVSAILLAIGISLQISRP